MTMMTLTDLYTQNFTLTDPGFDPNPETPKTLKIHKSTYRPTPENYSELNNMYDIMT